MLRDVDADRRNEVVIFTGTGQHWTGGVQPAPSPSRCPGGPAIWSTSSSPMASRPSSVWCWTSTCSRSQRSTGQGLARSSACCATSRSALTPPRSRTATSTAGSVPGDGMHLVLAELIGPKRAAHLAHTGATLSAEQALGLGLVSESFPASRSCPEHGRPQQVHPPAIRDEPRLTRGARQRLGFVTPLRPPAPVGRSLGLRTAVPSKASNGEQ